MIKLTVENAETRIEGLSKTTESLLKEELKYLNQAVSFSYYQNLKQLGQLEKLLEDKTSRFGVNSTQIHGEIRRLRHIVNGLQKKLFVYLYKDGVFSTGLLPKVVKLLQNAGLGYEITDRRIKPKSKLNFVLKESFPPLRYYQRAAAKAITEKSRGIVVAPTGSGKSLLIAKMVWDLQVQTLLITPSKAITDNMVDTLTKFFGKGRVQKLTTKTAKLKDINVVNIQALIKMKPELFSTIGAVFIDEFHHSGAETYLEVNKSHLKNTFFRVGVTATNFRSDGSDLALESVLSEVVYEYTIEQALKDGFLVKPEFIFEETFGSEYSSYQKEYKEALVNNSARNNKIAAIAKKHEKDSTIILVQQVEHGELLNSLIPNSHFIHGTETDTIRQRLMEDFKQGKIKCLIGTNVIGEGVDLPRAAVLIMAGGGKARGAVMQNVGRVLRPFPGKEKAVVYDFTDSGTRFLSEHSFLRSEIYKQYLV